MNSSSQKKKKSHVYVKDSTSLIESLELWDFGELEFTEPNYLGQSLVLLNRYSLPISMSALTSLCVSGKTRNIYQGHLLLPTQNLRMP